MRTRQRVGITMLVTVVIVVACAAVVVLSIRQYLHQNADLTAAPIHPAPHAAPPAHRKNVYIGVYEPGSPASYSGYNTFAKKVTKPDIVIYYSGWYEPFKTSFAEQAYQHHATTLVQLDPDGVNLEAIVTGQYDWYLHAFAKAVRTFGHPVIIGFGHEMNGPMFSWGLGHTPTKTYVAAWQHIVRAFRYAGADNVTWMWTINRVGTKAGRDLHLWWPGNSYVNWVGIDGYYFHANNTYQNNYEPTIAAVRKLTNRPILLSEVGIGQVAGQTAKLPGLFAGVKRDHLLGLVWFDVAQNQGIYHQDWRLEGHAASVAAFKRGVRLLETG